MNPALSLMNPAPFPGRDADADPPALSLSGRSTDRSLRRGCSVGGGTCSDLPVATGGTDSSGELFLNGGDGNWGSDVSEASRGNNRREKEERESLSSASGVVQIGCFENQGNESGYGSEPGYRGDAEIGYGDEVDTEEDEHRISVWGDKFQGRDTDGNSWRKHTAKGSS